jgi:excisionase family DNA binding protein
VAKPRLLTIAEVAELLSCGETMVRQLVRRGELAPPRKVGGKLARWFPSDVREYLTRLKLQQPDENFACGKPRQGSRSRAKPQSDSEA